MVRRAIFWSFAGQFVSFVLSFGGSIVVARLLSPHEVGLFAVAMATLGVLQVIAAFGVSTYAVREADLEGTTFDTAFTVNLILSVALAGLIVAASVPASIFLQEPAVATVLRFLALTPLIGVLSFRGSVMLQREMQFGKLSAIAVLSNAVSVGTTVTAAFYGASYMSPAYGSVLSGILATTLTILVTPRHLKLRTSLVNWRPITKFGLQMMSVGGVAACAAKLSDILLGRILGLSALGIFSRAGNLSNLISTYIYGTAMSIVYAQLAKDYRERGVVRDTFIPGLRMILALVGPLMLGMAVLAKPLVWNFYGDQWAAAAPILTLFMISQFLSLSFAMNWELYVVRNKLGLQVKLEVSRSLFGVLTRLVGCLFGMIGAAAATIVDAIFSIFLYVPKMPKMADSSTNELLRIYVEVVLLASVACLPSLILMQMYGWSAKTPVIFIIPAALLGGLLWLAFLFANSHPLASEISRLAQKLLRKPVSIRPT